MKEQIQFGPFVYIAMSTGIEVFEILMRENADMLLAFLRSSIRDPHSVDDIFQETMVVAWQRLDDFDRSRSFGKWIRGIAGNLTLGYYRRVSKNPMSFNESTLDWLESRFAKVQNIYGDGLSEKLALLNDCISSLPEEKRNAIEARYLKEWSLDEIVNKFGIALHTAKKRLYRAKLQLEDCISRKLSVLEEGA